MRARHAAVGIAILMMAAWSVNAAPVSAAFPTELPVFNVARAGLTSAEAARVSKAFGVEGVLEDGAVRYVSRSFNDVPMKSGTETGRDEDGRRTVASSFDLKAIRRIEPVPDEKALGMMAEGLRAADIPLPKEARPVAGHTMLEVKPKGGTGYSAQIATSVRYRLSLGGYQLIGPGADIGATFGPDGQVTELRESAFLLEQGEVVKLVEPSVAKAECSQQYPRGSKISLGLLYYAPPLSADVKTIYPYYQCRGRQRDGGILVQALVLAVPDVAPEIRVEATLDTDGLGVEGRVRISGGTPPYHVRWLSSSDSIPARDARTRTIGYELGGGGRSAFEQLVAIVTDANGLAAQASASLWLPLSVRDRLATADPGGTSTRALGTVDAGAEFNVTNWTCVQQSATGFLQQFSSRGIPIAFRYLAPSAWERDFRDASKGGDDDEYVDNVDLAWYTGHGSPASFTFDNASYDDGDIVPSDARWGDRDLEWLQLESCNVLQFTDGGGKPIWSRWARVFDGLHLLNGFQTTAACVTVSGGTAGVFSDWLLGKRLGFVTLPGLRVRQAWAIMALSLEPPGRQYVTMGVYGSGGVTNYDDFFWGRGPVGPDIRKSQIRGYWWLMGEV